MEAPASSVIWIGRHAVALSRMSPPVVATDVVVVTLETDDPLASPRMMARFEILATGSARDPFLPFLLLSVPSPVTAPALLVPSKADLSRTVALVEPLRLGALVRVARAGMAPVPRAGNLSIARSVFPAPPRKTCSGV